MLSPLYATFMTLTINQLTKDISTIDIDDILSCWTWKTAGMKAVAAMSVLGDLFLVGRDDAVHWLQTDGGELTRVADDLPQFEQYLGDEEKVDNWFLPLLVEQLIAVGKTLKENEVYSFKKMPVIGGEYSLNNIEPTDISVHFAFTGQISQQIKDLPDGTEVDINYES
jgi:hypothetical protein